MIQVMARYFFKISGFGCTVNFDFASLYLCLSGVWLTNDDSYARPGTYTLEYRINGGGENNPGVGNGSI